MFYTKKNVIERKSRRKKNASLIKNKKAFKESFNFYYIN